MYKKLAKISLGHALTILVWALIYHKNRHIESEGMINIISTFLLFSVSSLFYTEISSRDNKKLQYYLGIFPCYALLMDKNFGYGLLVLIFFINMAYVRKKLRRNRISHINLFPISSKMTQYFTLAFIIFILLLAYLMDLGVFYISMIIQIVFLVCEIFYVLFTKERDLSYDRNFRVSYLSDYLEKERNNFSRLIHDGIIQDIFAARNLLSLKNPRVENSIKILSDLEIKLRQMMTYYQTNLFEDYSLEDSLEAIFDNIEKLYRDKPMRIVKDIKISNTLSENDKKILLLITKELLNNSFKHGNGTYIIYLLEQKESRLYLTIENDGVREDDFENIKKSKKGVLLLNMLVEARSGNISRKYFKNTLKTEVDFGYEDNYLR